MFNLLIASNNQHKIKEFKEMFLSYDVNIYSPNDLGIKVNPNENGKTFEENSFIKAEALTHYTNMAIIADDSGLCVKSLHDFPGICSARFADSKGGNKIANLELIKMLEPYKDKTAKFVCVITLLNVEKNPVVFKGECEGKILDKPDGDCGFGYDPIFYSYDAKCSFGTCSESIKNKYYHRAIALQKLFDYLKNKNLI